MDDYKIILYIVLGGLYYGYKFLSKKKEEPAPTPVKKRSQQSRSQETHRPTSVQDLLQEVKRQQEKNQKPVSRPFYETLEQTNYETIDYDTNPEKAVVENVNPYTSYKTLNANTMEDGSSRFAEFVTGEKKQHPILNSLKSKSKVREAFIMSEIFSKKTD